MRLFTLLVLGACSFSARTAQQRAGDAAGSDAVDAGIDGLPATCTPNETACEGRVVKTCGAAGTWDSALDTVCDFTCSAGACVVASNVAIADVAMCGSNAPALAPPPGATVTMATDGTTHLECTPDCGNGVTRIDRTNVITSVQPNVAWFCLSQLSLAAGVTMTADPTSPATSALVFIVDGPVTIAGTLAADGASATNAVPGGKGGPGGFAGSDLTSSSNSDGHGPCAGKGGDHDGPSFADHWIGGGGGGGGNATAGANGGTGKCVNGDHTGNPRGASNASCSMPDLIPLVGGSGGGAGGDATVNVQQGWAGGGGGGAIEIASRVSITVTGTLAARGGAGYGENSVDGGGGGGAGGSLLLEAPTLSLSGMLVVDGGAGGSSGAGAGGAGASGASAAGTGKSFAANGQGGSGGGGGGGRVRLNATHSSCPATVSPTSACSPGPLVPQ